MAPPAPRIVLFSPIAHEDLGDPRLPDGRENNRRLAAYAGATAEAAERTEVGFVDLFSLTQGLYDAHRHFPNSGAVAEHAIPMPGGNREGRTIDLAGRDVAELTLKAIVEEMRYDVDEFRVEAGQPVVLHFENPDFMPHNLMIVEPGKADEVGRAAQQMGAEGFEKQFIPEHSAVKFTTPMLNHGQRETLEFIAPVEPGDYEFVCTFPGHHIMMRGIMRVLPSPAKNGFHPGPD